MTSEQQTLWDQGYRPFEIYTFNDSPVKYLGEWKEAGEVPGWKIKYVFSTRENIKTFPYFECVIEDGPAIEYAGGEVEVWHG